jgi:hypothetical protein
MKKVFMFMAMSLLTAFSIGCSSDDGGEAPIIEPPIETDYEKFIQNEWVFTKYQLLDKDRKVVFELDAKGSACKSNIWIFREELDENKKKVKIRTDFTYLEDSDTKECKEYKKEMPYSIENSELVTALLDDVDLMRPFFFEIREMRKNKMLLIRKDYVLTAEDALLYGFPKEAKYLQYELKSTK